MLYDVTKHIIPNLLAGLVVPDVPLEETEFLRKEALKNEIELVRLPLRILDEVFSFFFNPY